MVMGYRSQVGGVGDSVLSSALPQNPGNPAIADGVAHGIEVFVFRCRSPRSACWQVFQSSPSSGTETGSSFIGLRVSDASAIAHGFGGPPNCSVQHTVGIRETIRASAIDLQCKSVVVMPGNRPTCGCDTDKIGASPNPDSEFPSTRRFVVSMMLFDKFLSIS